MSPDIQKYLRFFLVIPFVARFFLLLEATLSVWEAAVSVPFNIKPIKLRIFYIGQSYATYCHRELVFVFNYSMDMTREIHTDTFHMHRQLSYGWCD